MKAEDCAYEQFYERGHGLMEEYLRVVRFPDRNLKVPAKAIILASMFRYRVGDCPGAHHLLKNLLDAGDPPWRGVGNADVNYLKQYSAELLEHCAGRVPTIEQATYLLLAEDFDASRAAYLDRDVHPQVRGLYPLVGAFPERS